MWLTLLDLSSRSIHPDYHDKSRDIETALAWNTIQKTLANTWRSELFKYIKSIKISEKNIAIATWKPIANAELKIYSELILSNLNENFIQAKLQKKEKLIFK